MEPGIKQNTNQAEVAQACETKFEGKTIVVMGRRKPASTLFGIRSDATIFSHPKRFKDDMQLCVGAETTHSES
jgi:hypothetical protein